MNSQLYDLQRQTDRCSIVVVSFLRASFLWQSEELILIHIIPEVMWLQMSSLMQMKGMINDVLECVTVIILQSFFLFCSFFFFPPNFIFVVVNKRVTSWKMRLLKIKSNNYGIFRWHARTVLLKRRVGVSPIKIAHEQGMCVVSYFAIVVDYCYYPFFPLFLFTFSPTFHQPRKPNATQ